MGQWPVILAPGQVVWIDVSEVVGREQAGRRPWILISSRMFLARTSDLVTATPCTTRDRGWEHHVRLTGQLELSTPTFAVTEQVRTFSRERVLRTAGILEQACLDEVMAWVRRWLA